MLATSVLSLGRGAFGFLGQERFLPENIPDTRHPGYDGLEEDWL